MDMQQNDLLSVPQEQKQEDEYMSTEILALYKKRLRCWKADLLRQAVEEEKYLDGVMAAYDVLDDAQKETDVYNQNICPNRRQYLLAEIEEALERIEQGEYGYCQITGEAIGLRRLDCWPIARLSIRAQQVRQNQFRLIAGLR